MTTRISACLIVRDEEAHLRACLESLQPLVDELCVLDTGSTDRSLAIARELGAKTDSMQWADDFSLARNRSLALASGDWVLVVDADERLEPVALQALQALREELTATSELAFTVTLANQSAAGGSAAPDRVELPRLFRRRPDIAFSRAVHESVMEDLRKLGVTELRPSGLVLDHSGYLPQERSLKRKHFRNARLLVREAKSRPEDPYVHYKLAQSLSGLSASELQQLRAECPEAPQSEEALAESLELLLAAGNKASEYPFAGQAAARFVDAARERGELDVCAARLERLDAAGWQEPELDLARAEWQAERGDLQESVRLFDAAIPTLEATRSSIQARSTLALDRRAKLGRLRALSALALCGEAPHAFAEELEKRKKELAEHPALQALEARHKLMSGDMQGGAWILGRALDRFPLDAEVGLLAGELAWSHNESSTAIHTWERIADDSVAGSEARALAIFATLAGKHRDENAQAEAQRLRTELSQLRPRSPRAAAVRLLTELALSEPPTLQTSFLGERVLAELGALLQELLAMEQTDVVERFAAGASGAAHLLSGVDQLIVRDDS